MKKFVPGQPEEGTPTLGVVFYILHYREIRELTGLEPIGYVVDDEDGEGVDDEHS